MNDRQLLRRRRGRGVSAVYSIVMMTVICGFCSLAADFGRVQLVKVELRGAADAAARAAVAALPSITAAQNQAVAVAAQNSADAGSAVALDSTTDVELGTWNESTRTFTALAGAARSSATAVRVTARRTAARGNAVPLFFARFVGQPACNVEVQSVAAITPLIFGMVGLDSITMSGNSSDSYWSSSGYAGAGGAVGNIGSNGPITLGGSSSISGNARPGIGYSVNGASKVSGLTTPLTTPLAYPNGDPGTAATSNNNVSVPVAYLSGGNFSMGNNKSCTLPGGIYYFNNFSMSGSASLTFTGPATIYCYGTYTQNGNTDTSLNVPQNLKLVMVPGPGGAAPGAVTIGSSAAFYGSIYAPQSPVTFSGSGDLYGTVVGKSINMTGSSGVHFDLSLGAGGVIRTVK